MNLAKNLGTKKKRERKGVFFQGSKKKRQKKKGKKTIWGKSTT